MHRIVYIETFISTIKCELLRIFLAIAIMLEMILVQIDAVEVYLESSISSNKQLIYIKIPQRCLAGRKKLVCKILKNLYRLKQIRKL